MKIIRHRDKQITDAVCAPGGRIIKVGGYRYTLHPFQAVLPQDPKLLKHAAEIVAKDKDFNNNFDYIFALAQKSIPFATILSQETGKPLLVAYSRRYEDMSKEMKKTEIKIIEPKKYSAPFILYSYFLKKGDKVTVTSDDMNWGDANVVTARALLKKGIYISNFVVGVEKYDRGGAKKLSRYLKPKRYSQIPLHFCSSVTVGKDKMVPLNPGIV